MELISLRGICRAVGVTLQWLLGFLAQCFATLPDHLHVRLVSCTHDVLMQRLEGEADAMASFVQKKANKQWAWIAMDAKTRQVITFHVGDRSHKSVEHLWAKIPQAYRQYATFYTDQLSLSRFVVHDAPEARWPPRWLVDRALPCSPARVPGDHHCDRRRGAAPCPLL